MILGMQDFDFAQILLKFRPNPTKFAHAFPALMVTSVIKIVENQLTLDNLLCLYT